MALTPIQIGALIEIAELFRSYIDIPERNCRCHISPPCNDCVEYGALREASDLLDQIQRSDSLILILKADSDGLSVVESAPISAALFNNPTEFLHKIPTATNEAPIFGIITQGSPEWETLHADYGISL